MVCKRDMTEFRQVVRSFDGGKFSVSAAESGHFEMKRQKRATGPQPICIKVTVGDVVKEYVLKNGLLLSRQAVIEEIRPLHNNASLLQSPPPNETALTPSLQGHTHPHPLMTSFFQDLKDQEDDVFPVDLEPWFDE
jgi:hypothetical protein